MTPRSTEFRRSRRRQALLSALSGSGWLLFSALILLWLRHNYFPEGAVSVVLLVLACVDAAALIPLAYSYKKRLQEIEGGEEYEARQY